MPLLRQLVHHEQETRRQRVVNTERLLEELADLGGSDD